MLKRFLVTWALLLPVSAIAQPVPVGPVQLQLIPNCLDSLGQHLNFSLATGQFTCGSTSSCGGGSLGSQSANLIFASPNGSSGTPVFRALSGADLPFPSVSFSGSVQKRVGSRGDFDSYIWPAGGFEPLTEAGTKRPVVNCAADLQHQVGAAPRPPHLLRLVHPTIDQEIAVPSVTAVPTRMAARCRAA
jgi:hypothetical protein